MIWSSYHNEAARDNLGERHIVIHIMNVKNAVILAAGVGKRLDAFETPKPLIPVAGRTLIERTLDALAESGVNNFYIVVREGDILIPRALLAYPHEVTFIRAKEGATMLDAVLSLDGRIAGSFFVTMSDLVFGKNPFASFNEKGSDADIAILISARNEISEQSGANVKVRCDKGTVCEVGDLLDFDAFEAGIYRFTPKGFEIFSRVARRNNAETVSHVFSAFGEKRRLGHVYYDEEWFDINIPATLIKAEMFFKKISGGETRASRPPQSQRKLVPATILDHPKDVRFEVVVERGIVGALHEHELIPHEYFYSPHHLIVDKNLDALYGRTFHEALLSQGYRVHKILVDPGEKSKSMENFIALSNEMIDVGLDKKSVVISMGGGVVKDLAGFLASTLYRGIGFISIPTTVLSQCDAAIALKQGVNGEKGKNLIGSYYAPIKIVVDPLVLETLDERYVRDGIAEMLKQASAQDKTFFKFFKDYHGDVKNIDFLEEAIRRSIHLKVSSIQGDFYEEREALVNQYGHEVGHAVEYLTGYALGHGE
ncbi:iron-containing alcohol dehydrogenase, partial [bacterium]|nr:iron-containing alcohol dehydrogenase [bacterium]